MKCETCFRQCELKEGQTGLCMARKNSGNVIMDRNYGKITSAALDPIEKKPLAMYHPGSVILSVGSYGCNLRCPFCQNHLIAQNDLDDRCETVTPAQLVEKALALKPYGNIGIAFTKPSKAHGFNRINIRIYIYFNSLRDMKSLN